MHLLHCLVYKRSLFLLANSRILPGTIILMEKAALFGVLLPERLSAQVHLQRPLDIDST